jgi:HD-GYP domain-containing protein (c-di-GMP phosphodiesterase class II)
MASKLVDRAKEDGGNRVCTSEDFNKKAKGVDSEARKEGDVKLLKSKLHKLNKQSKQSIVESIHAFSKTIEMKDHYTGEHVEHTVQYATLIANELRLRKDEIELIKEASMLHDLGKIGISDRILLKRGRLSRHEYEEIKKHPQIGADIIRPIQMLHDVIPLIFYHHERWDGKGYPVGLKGDEIPIGARVIALADAYQALTSDRPYRKAIPKARVMRILQDESGSKYDPMVVTAFLRILKGESGRKKYGV